MTTSATAAATPPTGAPHAPSGLRTDGIYNGRTVPLRWTDLATDETGYRLERSPTADFTTVDLSVTLPPVQNVVGPPGVIVGAVGIGFTTTAVAGDASLVQPLVVCVTV